MEGETDHTARYTICLVERPSWFLSVSLLPALVEPQLKFHIILGLNFVLHILKNYVFIYLFTAKKTSLEKLL